MNAEQNIKFNDSFISNEQKTDFIKKGYLVINSVLNEVQLASMKESAHKIISKDVASSVKTNTHSGSEEKIFTTRNNDRTDNNYFLDSAESIRCFFEEDAFDENNQLIQDPLLCINKIGHALHELDPVFEHISHLPILGHIASRLGMTKPEIRQSMYIFKQPRIGGEVKWHQDATFFATSPTQSVITFWFAIEDATRENGCLWVETDNPDRPLKEKFVRHGNQTTMEELDNTPWPDAPGSKAKKIPIEVKAGSILCFKGNIAHYSAPNTSDKSRHAYTLHITDGTTSYDESNWLQSNKLPLRGFNQE